ncbi:MAG TPA: BtaA family protein [Pirellulaceae bacterium]|nr:BtaA family protein [Pirellulaceae bacterium]HMO93745.1 BtaA family protein [Pirellulaceae bacterium]HMP69918.1 BtaA family protein [Pirellulaceae bacterium]
MAETRPVLKKSIFNWVSNRVFNTVHRNNLVYNTCWEDPRLDRVALNIGPDDNIVVITSAGCNALDYTLMSPNHVYAVDMNPRQNALLDLKLAGIRNLEFDKFFQMFGEGYLPNARKIYESQLRNDLPERSRAFWDRRIKWFGNRRRSFYFRGTSGTFARMMKVYTDRFIKVRPYLDAMISAKTLEEQQQIYTSKLYDKFWTGLVKFTMNRDTILSMLGIPRAQKRQLENYYEGGIVKYIQDCVKGVFHDLPLKENYFWRLYMDGKYTRDCCPEYLKEENFCRLKEGLVNRLTTYTDSIQGFLEKHQGTISRFVLLDHMDWLCDHFFPLLESEWQAIVDRAAPNSRLIWRSGGLRTDYLNAVNVNVQGRQVSLESLLKYHEELARELHPQDRVHTYASFYIADLLI